VAGGAFAICAGGTIGCGALSGTGSGTRAAGATVDLSLKRKELGWSLVLEAAELLGLANLMATES
jgi:hypothetical protein